MWGQGFPFLVFKCRELILLFTLQHHPNWQWCFNLWRPLHLTYLDPWILQNPIACPHFQQFLHCGTPRFIFAPQIVVIKLSTLKHLLIRLLAFALLWTSQMLIQTMDMSYLGETLMTLSFDAKMILLKMWFSLMTFLTTSEEIRVLESSKR